jgi:hypothetical protein
MVKKRLNRFRLLIVTTEKDSHARRRSQRSIPVVTNKRFAPIAPRGAPVPHEPMLTPTAAQTVQAEEMANWPLLREKATATFRAKHPKGRSGSFERNDPPANRGHWQGPTNAASTNGGTA